MTCAIDETQSMLLEAGFSKPFTKITLEDKSNVCSVLINYHCMTKVKAAMDQYIDGLESLDVLESVRREPVKWRKKIVDDGVKVEAGMYMHICMCTVKHAFTSGMVDHFTLFIDSL